MSVLRIKEFRENLNFSQRVMADKLNIKQASYWRWEKGMVLPNAEQILKLCEVFECSPNDLLAYDDKVENNDSMSESVLQEQECTNCECKMFFDVTFNYVQYIEKQYAEKIKTFNYQPSDKLIYALNKEFNDKINIFINANQQEINECDNVKLYLRLNNGFLKMTE